MSNFKKIQGNFVATSRQIAQDERLTWKARGIFLYLASMNDGWNFYVDEIAEHSPQGKRALQGGLKELEEYGYLKRIRTHKESGDLSTFDWELHFEPVSLQQQKCSEAVSLQQQKCSEAVLLRKQNVPLISNNSNKEQETISNNNNNILSSCGIPYQEIVEYLNKRTGKKFKYKSKATQRLIKARWNEGFKLDDFKKVIDNKCLDWLRDEKMSEYLRPATLFGTKFESYFNQKTKQPKQQKEKEWLF